jgi:methylmalonyl-CoA mutase N-terminal domain/subunit
MAAVLGGTQSLHTNSMDETLALPTEHAVQVALRTQQVLAFESGVPNVIDPLGGSYYVEKLTDEMEQQAEGMFEEIVATGGVVRGLETGWFQRKIAESAARQQWEIEQHRRVIVGVNEFVTEEDALSIPLLKIDEQAARDQASALAKLRTTRDSARCERNIAALRAAAAGRRTSCRSFSTAPGRIARCTRSAPRSRACSARTANRCSSDRLVA